MGIICLLPAVGKSSELTGSTASIAPATSEKSSQKPSPQKRLPRSGGYEASPKRATLASRNVFSTHFHKTANALAIQLKTSQHPADKSHYQAALRQCAQLILSLDTSRERVAVLQKLISSTTDKGHELLCLVTSFIPPNSILELVELSNTIALIHPSKFPINIPDKLIFQLFHLDLSHSLKQVLLHRLKGCSAPREALAKLAQPISKLTPETFTRLSLQSLGSEHCQLITTLLSEFAVKHQHHLQRYGAFYVQIEDYFLRLTQVLLAHPPEDTPAHFRAAERLLKVMTEVLSKDEQTLLDREKSKQIQEDHSGRQLISYLRFLATIEKQTNPLWDSFKNQLESLTQQHCNLLKTNCWLLETDEFQKLPAAILDRLESYDIYLNNVEKAQCWYEIARLSRTSDLLLAIKTNESTLSGTSLANILVRVNAEQADILCERYNHWFSSDNLAWIALHHPHIFRNGIFAGRYDRPEYVRLVANTCLVDPELSGDVITGKCNPHITPDWLALIAQNHAGMKKQVWKMFCQLDHKRLSSESRKYWTTALHRLASSGPLAQIMVDHHSDFDTMAGEICFSALIHHPDLITPELCKKVSACPDGDTLLQELIRRYGKVVFDSVSEAKWQSMNPVKLSQAMSYHERLCLEWLPNLKNSWALVIAARAWPSAAETIVKDSNLYQHLTTKDVRQIQLVQHIVTPLCEQLPQGTIGMSFPSACQTIFDPDKAKLLSADDLSTLRERYPSLAKEIITSGRFELPHQKLKARTLEQLYLNNEALLLESAKKQKFTRIQLIRMARSCKKLGLELFKHPEHFDCLGQSTPLNEVELLDIFSKKVYANALVGLHLPRTIIIALAKKYPHFAFNQIQKQSLAILATDTDLFEICLKHLKVCHYLLTQPSLKAISNRLLKTPEQCMKVVAFHPSLAGFIARRNHLQTEHWESLLPSIPREYYRLIPDTVHLPYGIADATPSFFPFPGTTTPDFLLCKQSDWIKQWPEMDAEGCCAGFALDFIQMVWNGHPPMDYAKIFEDKERLFSHSSVHERISYLQTNQSQYTGKVLYKSLFNTTTGRPAEDLSDKLLELLPAHKVLYLRGARHAITLFLDQDDTIYLYGSNVGISRFQPGNKSRLKAHLEAIIPERFACFSGDQLTITVESVKTDKMSKPVIKNRVTPPYRPQGDLSLSAGI